MFFNARLLLYKHNGEQKNSELSQHFLFLLLTQNKYSTDSQEGMGSHIYTHTYQRLLNTPSPTILTVTTLLCHYGHSNRVVTVILCVCECVLLHVRTGERGWQNPRLSDFLTLLTAAHWTM